MREAVGVLLAVLLVVSVPAAPAAAAEVTMTVTVVDQNGDSVGSGVTVTATWDDGSDEGTTSSNGQVLLDVTEGADVKLTISHPDYVRNQALTVRDAGEQSVEMPVWPTGKLTVSVVNTTGAIADADIQLTKNEYTFHGTTNESGTFATKAIEQGTYTLRVRKSGYVNNVRQVEVDGNVSTTVAMEPGSVDVGFTVVDEHFDTPRRLEGAEITVHREGKQIASVTTLSNGNAGTQVPVNTQLTLRATKDGYNTTEQRISVDQQTKQFKLAISREDAIRVSVLSDRVVAGETTIVEAIDEYGDPVAEAAVLLDGERIGTTDADGELRITVDEAGEHTVQVQLAGLSSEELTVSAFSGDGTTTATTSTTTTTTATTTTATSTTSTTTATTTTATSTTSNTTATTTTDSGGVPGFTVAVALLALAGATLFARD
jgi:hypothetical protein